MTCICLALAMLHLLGYVTFRWHYDKTEEKGGGSQSETKSQRRQKDHTFSFKTTCWVPWRTMSILIKGSMPMASH